MEAFARAIVLVVVAALLAAYLKGGGPAVKAWLAAKFLGHGG